MFLIKSTVFTFIYNLAIRTVHDHFQVQNCIHSQNSYYFIKYILALLRSKFYTTAGTTESGVAHATTLHANINRWH